VVGVIVGGVGGVPISVVTAIVGAGTGGVVGYIYCAKDDTKPPYPRAVPTCDNPPKATQVPVPPRPPGDKCTDAFEACLGWGEFDAESQ
jgi:hypothetical protein